jgi:hypothetical protein
MSSKTQGSAEEKLGISQGYKKYVVFRECDNAYTILTKKYQDNVVGFIDKTSNNATVKIIHFFENNGNNSNYPVLSLKKGCPHVNVIKINDHPYNCCDLKDYYKYCYLMKLPFDVPDSIREISGSSRFIMIKNNYMYIGFEQAQRKYAMEYICTEGLNYGLYQNVDSAQYISADNDKQDLSNVRYYCGFYFSLI